MRIEGQAVATAKGGGEFCCSRQQSLLISPVIGGVPALPAWTAFPDKGGNMSALKKGGVLFALLLLAGCVSTPLTPKQLRALVDSKSSYAQKETFEVKHPYREVTQYIKRKSDECLDRTFKVTYQQSCGFFNTSTCSSDGGMTKYIPVSTIGARHAEFYTKFWDSEARAINTPAGDKMIMYLAEVSPVGRHTSVTLYTYTNDRYKWARDIMIAWAKGEDPGCPVLSGEY
jgi:hypothetical protein